ncbi:hypothetical protein N806_04540 [Rhodococcus sp. P27]|nr:hypothetical protein N806_04540 [Rhodococcus sp. P27]
MVPVTFADTNPSRVNAVVARFGTGFAEGLVAARSNVQLTENRFRQRRRSKEAVERRRE